MTKVYLDVIELDAKQRSTELPPGAALDKRNTICWQRASGTAAVLWMIECDRCIVFGFSSWPALLNNAMLPAADALFFVEGCGQGAFGANWGDGFVTDPTLITPGSSNDPTAFFNAVVDSKYKYACPPCIRRTIHVYSRGRETAKVLTRVILFGTRVHWIFDRTCTPPATDCVVCLCIFAATDCDSCPCCSVVVSPHVYPPTITRAQSAFTGPAFWTRLSYSFGYFNTVRICTEPCGCAAHKRLLQLGISMRVVINGSYIHRSSHI